MLFLLFVFFSCHIESNEFEIQKEEIFNVSKRFGFKIEQISNRTHENGQIYFENLAEYEKFLNYLRKSYDKNSAVNYSEIEQIFLKNGLDLKNNLSENENLSERESGNALNSNRIQCIPNAMLVYARVRNMPFPGFQDGLNGVQIGMEFQNGNLKPESTTWGMYGFYPFLGVQNGQIIQLQPPSFTNNYTTTLTAHYTVVWYSMIGDISIANFATMKVDIKVNACSGETLVLWTEI